jgi:predicted Zn-dependent peptidase
LAKLYKPNEQIEVLTDVNKKNQAHIIEGFKFKQNGNIKDDVTISLLESILGGSTSSRLFRDLREKRHLAYTVGAHVAPHGDSGVFTLDIKTTTENHESGEKTFDNLQKSIVGFNENIERIKTEKISEEELNNAKKFMKSGFLTSAETTSGKNSMLKDSVLSLYGADYMNEMFKLIDEISVDDIYNCANYVFAGKPVYSVTATQDTLNANKEFLDSLKK